MFSYWDLIIFIRINNQFLLPICDCLCNFVVVEGHMAVMKKVISPAFWQFVFLLLWLLSHFTVFSGDVPEFKHFIILSTTFCSIRLIVYQIASLWRALTLGERSKQPYSLMSADWEVQLEETDRTSVTTNWKHFRISYSLFWTKTRLFSFCWIFSKFQVLFPIFIFTEHKIFHLHGRVLLKTI